MGSELLPTVCVHLYCFHFSQEDSFTVLLVQLFKNNKKRVTILHQVLEYTLTASHGQHCYYCSPWPSGVLPGLEKCQAAFSYPWTDCPGCCMLGVLVESGGWALVIAAIIFPFCGPLGAPQVTAPSLRGLTPLSGQAGVVAYRQPPSIIPLRGRSLVYTWA